MILEATGFGFRFLNFKTESTGFGFGLGFLSPSWLRLRSHQPGFQPNPGGGAQNDPSRKRHAARRHAARLSQSCHIRSVMSSVWCRLQEGVVSLMLRNICLTTERLDDALRSLVMRQSLVQVFNKLFLTHACRIMIVRLAVATEHSPHHIRRVVGQCRA